MIAQPRGPDLGFHMPGKYAEMMFQGPTLFSLAEEARRGCAPLSASVPVAGSEELTGVSDD